MTVTTRRLDTRTKCSECMRSVHLRIEERSEDDGSVLTVVVCPKCKAEWPSSRTTPRGRDLMDEIERQREAVGDAFRTPRYADEKANLDVLLKRLRAEVRKV